MTNVPSPWHVTALTLFPEMFPGPLGYSLAGKALEEGIWNLETLNIRDFATNKHQNVDDKPFGGGIGMVMRPDVLEGAIESVLAKQPTSKLIYMSPRGQVLTQAKAKQLITTPHITILCGRFEGVDQRVLDAYNAEEISAGDFILSGGEIAALTLMDCCIRLLPGVIGKKGALDEESFGDNDDFSGLLEYPHYTRPSIWREIPVPDVLLSGHHEDIKRWRLAQAQELTEQRRSDLWKKYLQYERAKDTD